MPKIIGGTFESEEVENVELKMQRAILTGIIPSATLNVYGATIALGSPRAGGSMLPLAIHAVCASATANVSMRINPYYSDGTTGLAAIWTPFTNLLVVRRAIMLVNNLGSIPEVSPAGSEGADMNLATGTDLSKLWSQGLWLQSLLFSAASSGNNDTASITVTYWGMYT